MSLRSVFTLGLLTAVWGLPAPDLVAQAQPPQTYSLTAVSMMTEASMFSGRPSNVKASRDGSRELVELTLLPGAAGSTPVEMRYLFDFEAHKAYTLDVVNKSCAWMRYVSSNAPMTYDSLSGSAAALAGLAMAKPLGVETVNGIRARRYELPGSAGQPTSRLWIADKENFVVKAEMGGPNGAVMPMLEVKQVSYEKPPSALFTPPSDCTTQTQGEWSENGVNAHASSSATVSGSGSADLGGKGRK